MQHSSSESCSELREPVLSEQEQGAAVSSPPVGGSARVSRAGFEAVLGCGTIFRRSSLPLRRQQRSEKIVREPETLRQHARRLRYPEPA